MEPNGTSIVDVTDPRRPLYLNTFLVAREYGMLAARRWSAPVTAASCRTPTKTKIFCRATSSSLEVYDVTDPSNPALVTTIISNLGDTHKN